MGACCLSSVVIVCATWILLRPFINARPGHLRSTTPAAMLIDGEPFAGQVAVETSQEPFRLVIDVSIWVWPSEPDLRTKVIGQSLYRLEGPNQQGKMRLLDDVTGAVFKEDVDVEWRYARRAEWESARNPAVPAAAWYNGALLLWPAGSIRPDWWPDDGMRVSMGRQYYFDRFSKYAAVVLSTTASIIVGIIGVAFIVKKWLLARSLGICHVCGYDLRGGVSNICPECGASTGTRATSM